MVERAPQAEALAASWIERVRPLALQLYLLRRRIATVAVAVLAGSLFVHVMFGANGMVVYKQKRAEYQELRKQIVQVQQENDRYTQQIQGLEERSERPSKKRRASSWDTPSLENTSTCLRRQTKASACESHREKVAAPFSSHATFGVLARRC